MQRSAFARVLTLVATTATAATLSTVPATAAPSWSEPISEVFTETVTDWCGATGLTVRVDGSVQGWEGFKPSGGPGSLSYYHSKVTIEQVHTGPNGVQTRYTANVIEKDTRVTATDSTLEIDVLATGNATLYGPDGNAIARDPGQARFHISIDNETGEETFTLLRDSTGRTDDFCDAELALFGA